MLDVADSVRIFRNRRISLLVRGYTETCGIISLLRRVTPNGGLLGSPGCCKTIHHSIHRVHQEVAVSHIHESNVGEREWRCGIEGIPAYTRLFTNIRYHRFVRAWTRADVCVMSMLPAIFAPIQTLPSKPLRTLMVFSVFLTHRYVVCARTAHACMRYTHWSVLPSFTTTENTLSQVLKFGKGCFDACPSHRTCFVIPSRRH